MSYNKTTWTNVSGQPINSTNLNKLEQGVADAHNIANIKTWYESNDDTNAYTDSEKTTVASVSSIVSRVAALETIGITVLSGSNRPPQTIAVTATKVLSFDTLSIDVGVGTGGSVANQRAIAELNGVFKIRYEAFLSYASNVDITWQIHKNGSPFGAPITISGQGATPFPFFRFATAEFLENDYVELHATASAETDITILQANGTFEKTYF